MKAEAKKQFEPISIVHIKETLKKHFADKFDKMIITNEQSVKRGDYIFLKLKYQTIERELKKIKFPLHDTIRIHFTEFEGGEGKFGEKAQIKSDRLFETLEKNYLIKSQIENSSDINNFFRFPLDATNGEINPNQLKYFIPDQTYRETCDQCKGEKYINCQDDECNGEHNWTCSVCSGDGKVTCKDCGGDCKNTCLNCSGHGYVKCGSGASDYLKRNLVGNIAGGGCGGTGKVKDIDAPGGYRTCKTCRGRGEVPCEECGTKGDIKCDTCSGSGCLKCIDCYGKGNITCSECYGDREKYGKIDCSQCKTIGTMAQVVFVESYVIENENDKIIVQGDKLNINDSHIQKHVKANTKTDLVYKKVNDDLQENYDEYSLIYAANFEIDLGLNKDVFPLLTKEEIYYQVVPCVELSYRHILTNTLHEFTIVDFWNNPEVIFHTEPEHLKQDLGNATKSVSNFFGKLFKTKVFKLKEDKLKEIILFIYLAKADGKIEEQEKVYLSEIIGGLVDFTNFEKQKLFDIMNSSILPELTISDVTFSSKEYTQEVVSKLVELAKVDGEMELAEKVFIDKIKSMI